MILEINSTFVKANTEIKVGGTMVSVAPPVSEDYWLLRVPLSDKQAIVAFPKFFTIGIGFQKEEDWNTNLPASCDAIEIFNHIAHNKMDDRISDADCIRAIEMVQAGVAELSSSGLI